MKRKVVVAKPLSKYRIKLIFEDGEERTYDANGLVLKFTKLKKGNVFRAMIKNMSGRVISWGDETSVPEEAILDIEKNKNKLLSEE